MTIKISDFALIKIPVSSNTEGEAESTSSRPPLSLQGREYETPRTYSVIMIITLFKS